MRIGIDARLYQQTGVGRYIQNLLRELAIIDKENFYIVYLKQEDFRDFKLPNERWDKKIINASWHSIKEQFLVPYVLLKDRLDVAHFPYFNVPVFYPKKSLLTIHDLIIDHFDTGRASTHFYPIYKIKRLAYKLTLWVGIKKASSMIAISSATKKEIIDHYKVKSGKITVTYDALDQSFKENLEIYKPRKLYKFPYILYVGNAYPHKNLERLLSSFELIRKKKELKLVLVGDDKFFFSRLRKYVGNRDFSKEVIFFGKANNEDLINLYTNALCLVTPSLMEGFGLVNLEAVACGRLAVVSDIPPFREIWGESLFYFDPYNIKDLAARVLEVITLSLEEYSDRVKEAQKRVRRLSWRKTAVATHCLYQKIYEDRFRL